MSSSTEECRKTSPSEAAAVPSKGEVILMRLTIKDSVPGVQHMTDGQIVAAYKDWRECADKERAERVERERREAFEMQGQRLAESRRQQLADMRKRLGDAGVDATGLSDEQVEAKLAEWRAEQARAEEQVRMRQRGEALFRKAGCPERHVLHMDTIAVEENSKWVDTRDRLVERAGDGYLVALLGRRGTGKTQLVVSVIHQACGMGLRSRYVKCLDLFREIRGTYTQVARGKAGEREEDVVEALTDVDVLVIDEAHQRAETPFEQNTLINLLDRRYDAMRSTILVANLGKEEFAASLGDSVVSRIYEAGDAIVCDWPSYRKPGMWNSPDVQRRSTERESGQVAREDD